MDISKIFKSKTRTALFRLYYTNPKAGYYLRELERLLNIPVSMIRTELIRLREDGIFVSSKKGNLAYYALNEEYPLFEEFRSIVKKTVGVNGTIKELLLKVKGIKFAFIYGSYARNQENTASDIDVFIIGNPDENNLLRGITRLEKALNREINYSLYSIQEFTHKKKGKDSFLLDVIKNPKIFLIGDNNDL